MIKYLILFYCISSIAEAGTIKQIIENTERIYKLPPGLLLAIAEVESGGNPNAFIKEDGISHQSSHGLFQIQLGTARHMGFKGTAKQLMKPQVNATYAALYLKWLLELSKNDYSKALTCYNSGPASDACKSDHYYSRYVGKVFNSWIKQRSVYVSNPIH